MALRHCYVYAHPQQSNWNEVLEKLHQASGWETDRIQDHIEQNKMFIIEKIEEAKALALIQEFHQLHTLASMDNLPPRFQKLFSRFNQGFEITWNWFAAIFHIVWYFFAGLYAKMILLALAVYWLEYIFYWTFDYGISWILIFTYAGLFGNYDFYLRSVKGEKLWPKAPWRSFKPVFWVLLIGTLAFVLFQEILSNHWEAQIGRKNISVLSVAEGSFQSIPGDWQLNIDPPKTIEMQIAQEITPEKVVDQKTIPANYVGFTSAWVPGLKAVIIIKNDGAAKNEPAEKGMISIIQRHVFQDTNPKDDIIVRQAFDTLYPENFSPLLKFLHLFYDFSQRSLTLTTAMESVTYTKVGNQLWGTLKLNNYMDEARKKAFGQKWINWTIVNHQMICIQTSVYLPYTREVDQEVKQFLRSFKKSR